MDESLKRRFQQDCLDDSVFFVENGVVPVYIQPNKGPIEPMRLKPLQRRLLRLVSDLRAMNGYVRIVLCKARRVGSTSAFVVDSIPQTIYQSNYNTVIGAQLDETARYVHAKVRTVYDRLPMEFRPARADKSESFDVPMYFRRVPDAEEMNAYAAGGPEPDHGLSSSFSYFTQKTKFAKTGEAIQHLILTEFAKYDDQSRVMREVGLTVPDKYGTIVIDSTCDRSGDLHQKYFKAAMEGKNEYYPVFIPAMDDYDECYAILDQDESRLAKEVLAAALIDDDIGFKNRAIALDFSGKEAEIYRDFLIPHWRNEEEGFRRNPFEFLKWRRKKIASMGGDETLVDNQYPYSWRNAWLGSGSAVYSLPALEKAAERAKAVVPLLVGDVVWTKRGGALDDFDPSISRWDGRPEYLRKDDFQIKENPYGQLSIYEYPVIGKNYVITSDFSEGYTESDYSVTNVWRDDPTKMVQVAHVRGRMLPEKNGLYAATLGVMYNFALLVPERNSCGAAGVAVMRNVYPVHRIYRTDDGVQEILPGDPSNVIGFYMSSKTKTPAVLESLQMVNQGVLELNHPNTIHELTNYIHSPKASSRYGAQLGEDPVTGERYMDDEVTTVLMACSVFRREVGRYAYDRAKAKECLHQFVSGRNCRDCGKKLPWVERFSTEEERRRAFERGRARVETGRQITFRGRRVQQ